MTDLDLPPDCLAVGCLLQAQIRGLCRSHYHGAWRRKELDRYPRTRKGVKPGAIGRRLMNGSPDDRLMAHREVVDGPMETPCWASTYWSHPDGYARVQLAGKSHLVHRVAYECFVGPIPDGLVIDHLCRNRMCINPDHLEPVTYRENMLRGMSPAAIARRSRSEVAS